MWPTGVGSSLTALDGAIPLLPHLFIFPLGECCVRANVRILSAFLGTRNALCYKKTFKKDSTFSALHAALSNSWQGLCEHSRSDAFFCYQSCSSNAWIFNITWHGGTDIQHMTQVANAAPTKSELAYRYRHIGRGRKACYLRIWTVSRQTILPGLPNQSKLVPARGRLLLQNLQLLPIIHACACAKVI